MKKNNKKNRLFKMASIVLVAFLIYSSFHIIERKNANAQFCPCINWPVVGGVLTGSFVTSIINQFVSSAIEMVTGYFDLTEQFADQQLEDLEKWSREDRLAESKIKEQEAMQNEVRFSDEIRNEIEIKRYEALKDLPAPSDQTCGITTGLMTHSRADISAVFIQDIFAEETRTRTFSSNYMRQNHFFNTLKGTTPYVRSLNSNIQLLCDPDSQKGRAADYCLADDLPARQPDIDQHLNTTEIYAGEETLEWDGADANRITRLSRRLVDSMPKDPVPVNEDDASTKLAAMERIQEGASLSISRHILDEERAKRTEAPEFIGGDCTSSKTFVQEVEKRRTGQVNNSGVNKEQIKCPSLASTEKALIGQTNNVSDLVGNTTAMAGNEKSTRLNLAILGLKQGHQAYIQDERAALQYAISQLTGR